MWPVGIPGGSLTRSATLLSPPGISHMGGRNLAAWDSPSPQLSVPVWSRSQESNPVTLTQDVGISQVVT